MPRLDELATAYIDRVVNRQDMRAVDEMVADDYRGSGPGWPATLAELRQFYEAQQAQRPGWRVDIQEVMELGDSVVVRAQAHGAALSRRSSVMAALEWMAHYRFRDSLIIEINLLAVVQTSGQR